jgi:hypothetical protein
MAPHHINDLPRREEREDTRQLMLGLIDDLPHQERRGTQLMKMLGLGLAVVLFVVLSGSRRQMGHLASAANQLIQLRPQFQICAQENAQQATAGRRSAAKLLSKDVARRIAANIAKLPTMLRARNDS